MDEPTPNQPLELFRRDKAHQIEWLKRHGAEVIDAVKLAYDSGVLAVMQGLDQTALDNALQAVVESGVATPKKSEAAEAAEVKESSENGSRGSKDEATAADTLPIVKKEPKDSGHFAHGPSKRLEIVRQYRREREARLVENKDRWAQFHHSITGKTLLSYEREFPEET